MAHRPGFLVCDDFLKLPAKERWGHVRLFRGGAETFISFSRGTSKGLAPVREKRAARAPGPGVVAGSGDSWAKGIKQGRKGGASPQGPHHLGVSTWPRSPARNLWRPVSENKAKPAWQGPPGGAAGSPEPLLLPRPWDGGLSSPSSKSQAQGGSALPFRGRAGALPAQGLPAALGQGLWHCC